MSFFDTQNPGIGGIDELTLTEEIAVQTIAALGTPLQVLRTNAGATGVEWTTLTGTGDVSKVGTPVNNQIGIWTGDGTIEGDTALTFDTTTDSLVIAASGNLLFGAVTILDDAAGTMTLSNIDAIDATTESTIEAAIDTLANLTSIQGHTVTLTGALIRAGAHSLTLTTTGATSVTLPTAGTLAISSGANTFTGIQTFSTPIDTASVATMTATVGGGVPTPPNDASKFLNGQGVFAVPAGSGDMVLASVQTNSGAKTFLNNTFLQRNPANTFSYTLTAGAIAADRVLNLPVITATDTISVLGLAQTYTAAKTFTSAAPQLTLGANVTTLGSIKMFGNTSGDVTLQPTAAAGTATVQTLPATTGTLVNRVTTSAGVSASNTDGALTFTLGAITPTTVNGHTFTSGSSTFTGTAAAVYTFPGSSKTIAANDGSNMTLASQATGDIITASSATAFNRLADVAVGSVLISGGVGVAPSYSSTPIITSIDIGNADTTISRSSAGIIAVEGVTIPLNSITNTHTAQQIELGHASDTTIARSGAGAITVEGVTVVLVNTSPTLATITTTGNIELGHASDTTLSRSSAGVIAVEGVVIPSISSTNTLTNKRVTKRVTSTSGPGATPTINTDNCDAVHLTAVAADITSMTTNLSGTPVEGDMLRIDFTDNGTARAITWGASFEASTVALPTTTVISTRLDVGFVWNTVTSKWRCVASV